MTKIIRAALICLALLSSVAFIPTHAFSQVYIWDDNSGSHVSNDRREVPDNILRNYYPESVSSSSQSTKSKVPPADETPYDTTSITFRGMRWGSSINNYPNMYITEDDGENKFYKLSGDKLSINDADLDEIVYGFYKGKLGTIFIRYKGSINNQKVLDALTEKYSAGYQSNRYIKSYWWCLGCTTTVSCDFKEITQKGTLVYIFKPLREEQDRDNKEKARKAAQDL